MENTTSGSLISRTSAIVAILGYFVYGNIEGAIGAWLIYIVVGMGVLLCIVPIIGFFVYYFLAKYWIIPKLLILTNLHQTWLISLIFYVDLAIGLILTVLIIGWIIFKIKG